MAKEGSDRELCLCDKCVSYPDCAVEPLLMTFCLIQEAPCEVARRGCQCISCKIHARHKFTMEYYCAEGSEESRS